MAVSYQAYQGLEKVTTSPVSADGSFDFMVSGGTPACVLFIDSAGAFAGYLVLGGGLDALPVNLLDPSAESVDLGLLKAGAGQWEADPLATTKGFNMTEAETIVTIQQCALFANVIRNPDADGDGSIDIVDGDAISLSPMYFAYAGDIARDGTVKANAGLVINNSRLIANLGNSRATGLSWKTPDGIERSSDPINPDKQGLFFSSPFSGTPPAGIYVLKSGTGTWTYEVPSLKNAATRIVVPSARFVFTQDGSLESVGWEFTAGGLAGLRPDRIITQVQIQVEGKTVRRIEDSPTLDPSVSYYRFGNPASFDDIQFINITYNDIFGGHYVVSYTLGNNS